ncbi:hypothetical protein HYPSUDRAFT_185831 [Hypholoma sublateritium FD-334 SS-4]|uniref:Uncharacterized protein n=1 Tax=Hypholoma sublateritium (strain FD-334 SS-4) TaxID=945553 RepID=A0A0D2PSQ2_HYPSF|nr:hypothetical protein HYPSUDRAFT_185831 [Hypholoma sublateritium FD-334 SS-4]
MVQDILANAAGDYLFLKSGLNVPLCAYFTSRIGAVGYLLVSVIYSTSPTRNCVLVTGIVSLFCMVAFSCSTLLFFLRLRAIYNQNHVFVATFFVLWLAFPALSIFFTLLSFEGRLSADQRCVSLAGGTFSVFVMQAVELVYDTLVFVAISWRLCQIAYVKPSGAQANLKVWIWGKSLPAFTKSLYLDGQVFYLTILISGIVVLVLTLTSGIPPFLQSSWLSPNVVIINIMACRVYRRTRMGMIRESEISTSAIGRAIPVTHPISFNNNNPTSSNATVPHHFS